MTTTTADRRTTDHSTIDRRRCRVLLGAARVARLAFVDEGRPRLVVMNHHPIGDDILLRTSEDSRLAALTALGHGVPVVLEVDSVSAMEHVGWSVVAEGDLRRDDRVASGTLPRSWRAGSLDVVLRMRVDHLTGRYVEPAQ
jgi:uncharacterized protein